MRLDAVRAALLAAALAAAAPAPASGQAAPAAGAQVDPALYAKALILAQTVQPRGRAVDQAMVVLERDFVPTMLKQPEMQALDKEHPGIIDAMWKGVAPLLRRQIESGLPELWERLAKAYAGHMSAAEIDAAVRFFGTPVGRKFIDQMNSRASAAPMLEDVLRNPDSGITRESYTKSVESAVRPTIEAMTPQEQQALGAFLASPAGKALAAAGPEASRSGLEWMNKSEPAEDAELEKAVEAAIEAFLAAEQKAGRKI